MASGCTAYTTAASSAKPSPTQARHSKNKNNSVSVANTESIYPTVKPGIMIEYPYRDFTGRFVASGDVKFEGIKRAAQFWNGPVSLDTHWGWEIGYRNMVFGRAGFDIGKFTAGGGVDVKNITVDFAYLHHDDLDETFRVSAGYRF